MNELINNLRLDAGISQLKDDPRLVVIDREGNVIDPLIGLEKFAELIVRECMDICNDIAEEYEHDDSDDYNVGKTESAIACRNHIYKRFMWSKE